MPLFYCGHSLIIRLIFGQNADEKQAVVIFDVSKGKTGDVPVGEPIPESALARLVRAGIRSPAEQRDAEAVSAYLTGAA
ncbi:hypothetical protein [Kluyvera sichuanensis]|uniref:hypothetical protein n=1 Tax=Kluyvera sichuanensis TaxID=2725494 RepID=UPI0039F6055B